MDFCCFYTPIQVKSFILLHEVACAHAPQNQEIQNKEIETLLTQRVAFIQFLIIYFNLF